MDIDSRSIWMVACKYWKRINATKHILYFSTGEEKIAEAPNTPSTISNIPWRWASISVRILFKSNSFWYSGTFSTTLGILYYFILPSMIICRKWTSNIGLECTSSKTRTVNLFCQMNGRGGGGRLDINFEVGHSNANIINRSLNYCLKGCQCGYSIMQSCRQTGSWSLISMKEEGRWFRMQII